MTPRQKAATRKAPRSEGSGPKLQSVLKFTADEIKLRSVDELVPFPNNPKIHTPEQIEALAVNMKEFGFDQPILIDEADTILKGHGRQLGARKAGLALVPTIVRKGLTAAQKWAIVISDNALPAMTGFDKGLLKIGLTTLAKLDYPLHLTGFDQVRLATFGVGAAAGQSDPDEPQDIARDPVSKLDDVWLLGSHRIICGDSTKKETVATLFAKDRPHLLVTDPPYGVSFERGKFVGRSKAAKGSKFEPIAGDDMRGPALVDLISSSIEAAFGDRDGTFYFWSASLFEGFSVFTGMTKAGVKIQSQIIWNKTPFVIGRADYHWKHEVCWYGFKGANHPWYGGRDKSTVWDIPKAQKMEDHPTQKPVECMKRPIENNSKQSDFVYDPFTGSGTTIIAAEMTGRACLAIELSPLYVDVCVRRWQKFSGKPAVLQGSKKTFDQIERDRSKLAA